MRRSIGDNFDNKENENEDDERIDRKGYPTVCNVGRNGAWIMNTWKAPEDVVAVVVLIDGCLSTYKIVRGYYDEDHKRQIEGMVSGMDGKYFNRHPGRIIVVGKIFYEWKEAEEWVRGFKAHPDENPRFFQDVYCTNRQEWNDIYDGTFKIPIGEKTKEDYVSKDGEVVIENPAWGLYQSPEMR